MLLFGSHAKRPIRSPAPIALGLALALILLAGGCATPPNPPTVNPGIYDARADGETQLASALAEARRNRKRVLLDLGANWCSDSQALYHLLTTDAGLRHVIQQHFVLVLVDVNQRDGPPRNSRLTARFGNPLLRGIPVLLVLSPEGALLNEDPSERLTDDAHQRPEEVRAYLRKWARPNDPSSGLRRQPLIGDGPERS